VRKWRRYARHYEGLGRRVAITIIMALGKAAAAAFFALTLSKLVRVTLGAGGSTLIEQSAIFATFLAVLLAGFSLGVRYNVVRLSQILVRDLRCKLVAALLKLDRDRLARAGRGEIQTILVRDTDNVDRMASSLIGGVAPACITIAALALSALWVAPVFGAASLVVALLLWLPSRALRNSIEDNIARYSAAFSSFNRGILLTLERLTVIRSSNLEDIEYAERDRETKTLFKTGVDTDWNITLVVEVLALLGNLATVALLAVGAVIAGHGTSLADVLTVCLILLLIRSQAAGISTTLHDVRTGWVSLDHIWRFLDESTPEIYCGQQQIKFEGNVRIVRVSFGFKDNPLLEDISLDLKPGTCVAITGPNGAGKTTLLNLILGHLSPDRGALFVEGVSYDHADLSCMRKLVGYVSQDPVIFAGTISENICYGHPDTNRQDLERAAAISGVAEFIHELPDGYGTLVGDEGAFLSGGQKQRIALARALIARPRLLLLDEPTNHLDGSAVLDLATNLFRSGAAPAIMVISHDPAILAAADEIHELREGRLRPYSVPTLKLVLNAAPSAGSRVRQCLGPGSMPVLQHP